MINFSEQKNLRKFILFVLLENLVSVLHQESGQAKSGFYDTVFETYMPRLTCLSVSSELF
jgi:hypothetical protein